MTRLDVLVMELARRGGMEMTVAWATEKEIEWIDWVADTGKKPYVSAVVSLSAWRYARAAVDRQHHSLDGCQVVWRDDAAERRI